MPSLWLCGIFMNKHLMPACAGLLMLACTFPVLAADRADNSLSLQQALQLTLQDNAELKNYPFYVRQIEGNIQQAKITPTAVADLKVSKYETTLTLSQNFELGNKRQTRIGFNTAQQQQVQAEFTIAKLDVLAETSRRYYRLLASQKQKTLLTTRIGQEQRALKIINKRAKAGSVAQADVANMALRLARSNNTLEQLQYRIELEKNRLAAMWLGAGNFNKVMGKLSQIPKLPDANQRAKIISQRLDKLPDYRYQVALSRLADTRLKLAQANGRADINIGLGLRHNDNTGNQSLVLNAAMPLNFLNSSGNPNRGRITSAQVQQQLSLEQIERKRSELEIELTGIQQNLEKDLRLAQRINKQLLPLASELLSNTQKAYRQGQYTVLQWIDAQDQVFNLEQDLIDSQVRIFNQILELERILGQSIVSAQ